ncbi:MAG: multicopper oxidase domain-containing protein [Pseudonocardiaceae bacterium]
MVAWQTVFPGWTRRCGGRASRAWGAIGAVAVTLLAASCGGSADAGQQTRNYYIGADEVAWNYAPAGTNMFAGAAFDDAANKFVQAGPDRIGATYTKCVYHGYTDASFSQQIPRPADQQYLGMLGPVIRAQVGDTVKVTFKNNCSFPASIHPHGVFYNKKDEGAPYNDGRTAADKTGDAVAPTSSTSTPGKCPSGPARDRWMAAR